MERDPHQLIEACIVSAHAIRSQLCFIYIRGEFVEGIRILEKAVGEAYAAGLLGKNILGTGIDLECVVHGGAGAYDCGEETALLESLEGKRGQPRIKPPFPATSGLYGVADDRQQRRDAGQRAAHPGARRRVVRGARHRKERRAEALLHLAATSTAPAPTRRRWARSRCAS